MKRYILAFFAGVVLTMAIGASTDSDIHDLSDSVKRIAHAVEKMAGEPQR